jgi:uncharacterized protein YbjT (DUF2867 family)
MNAKSNRIVVIGGTGLIGRKVVSRLRGLGHEAVAASPSTGVNTITGEGLAEALAGAQVVVDVANAPSFEDKAVLEFFETAGKNIIAAEIAAGVEHHVALSVVGSDRLPDSGYFRAKVAQEKLIQGSGVPFTIVRATQFFEFIGAIAQASDRGDAVRVSPALFQPIAAEDVAEAVVDAALAAPVNGITEVAGPEKVGLAAMVRKHLEATGEKREVIEDPAAGYFGTVVDDHSLTPGENPRLGSIRYDKWLGQGTALR